MTNAIIRAAGLTESCVGFVDDYGVGSNDITSNIRDLTKLFDEMSRVNYKLGADKLWLGYDTITFLGYKLHSGTISPDPEKTRAIDELLPPKTKTQVRAFLGITGYYRIFILQYASIARPLSELLRDDVEWTWQERQ